MINTNVPTNKSYIAYDDYNSTVTGSIIGTIRQTCSRNGLRNAVKLIEITKYESRQQHKDKNKTSN